MSTITELPTRVVGMSNLAYRQETDFDSRSYLHTVGKYGGEVQLWLDRGNVYFGGNAATAKGSDFDEIVTGILEGKKFTDMVVVPPDDVLGANGSKSTKAYKEWAAQQTGIICTVDQKWQYDKMLAGMEMNDASFRLKTKTTSTQVSVFFEIDGHKLKTRPDACCDDLWWDLKTTSNQWDDLFRSAIKFGYPEQEWLYVRSAMALGMDHFRMPFVFVQAMPPYRTRVMHLPPELVENAGQRLLNVMEEVRLRRSTGMYLPADANDITEMSIPAWALKGEEYVTL
jgi:hypothetical protein